MKKGDIVTLVIPYPSRLRPRVVYWVILEILDGGGAFDYARVTPVIKNGRYEHFYLANLKPAPALISLAMEAE